MKTAAGAILMRRSQASSPPGRRLRTSSVQDPVANNGAASKPVPVDEIESQIAF